MPSSPSNPTRHRAQIVAEAVVSAYIHEIAQPSRPRSRGRGDVHGDLTAAPGAIVSSSPHARPLGRAHGGTTRRGLERRPQPALELAA